MRSIGWAPCPSDPCSIPSQASSAWTSMQPSVDSGTTAFLFPGQGPQDASMLEGDLHDPRFRERYQLLCDVAGGDLRERLSIEGPGLLRRNEIASVVTMFRSALELDR